MSTVTPPPSSGHAVAEGGRAGDHEAAGIGWVIWAAAIVPVMFILPMYIFPFPVVRSKYDGRRLIEILWAAGLLLAFLRPSIRSGCASIWAQLSVGSRVAAVSFVGWSLLSALLSSAPAYSLREWSLITLLLVVALALGTLLHSRRAGMLEMIGLTLILYAILVAAEPLEHGFAHPRFLGQALAVVAPAVLFSGSTTLALISAPALAIGLLNGSRALVLTMVVVTIAAFVLWPERRRRMFPGLAALAVASVMVWGYSAIGFDASLQAAVERGTSSTGRIALWRAALWRFADAPLLGVGPGLLARAPGVAGPGVGALNAHPHNTVMLIAAETGIVGLVAATVLVVNGLRRLPRVDSFRRPWALALIGGGFHSLFSGTIIMPASQAMFTLVLAMALPASTRSGAPPKQSRLWGWIPLVLGMTALLIVLATLSLPVETSELQYPPRFWQQGFIP